MMSSPHNHHSFCTQNYYIGLHRIKKNKNIYIFFLSDHEKLDLTPQEIYGKFLYEKYCNMRDRSFHRSVQK